jgi:hypothetical protein
MLSPSLRRAAVFSFGVLCLVPIAIADTLKINSNPPGAHVELDGVAVGVTPFQKDFPGGYFHRTHTAIGERLEHAMVARLSFPGYATRELSLTEGPMNWVDLHGRNHGEYWLFKTSEFRVDLDPVAATFTGSVSTPARAQPAAFTPELSL